MPAPVRALFPALSLLPFLWGLPAQAEPPQRITNLLVYGDDPCPKGEGDEIVVCARRPESERYRIPKSCAKSRSLRAAPAGEAR